MLHRKNILTIALVSLFLILALGSFNKDKSVKTTSDTPDATAGSRREFTVNDINFAVRYIPSGSFTMGSPSSEMNRSDREGPQRKITISQGFWIMETQVTQGLYEAVMGTNPSDRNRGIGINHPVNRVSWNDAVKFCIKLSELTGEQWDLPAEAEWEYACRAGTNTACFFGNDSSKLDDFAWHIGNSTRRTHPVGRKRPNPWGLYDMHGNVWEWVYDIYGDYPVVDETDPKGPSSGIYRSLRGGSWITSAEDMRSASRYYFSPVIRYYSFGFRAVIR